MNRILTLRFKEIEIKDVPLVGGKNAALGEMYQKLTPLGVRVPNGFAITAEAYDYFVEYNNLKEKIKEILSKTNIYDVNELQKATREIRNLINQGEFSPDLKKEILEKFEELKKEYGENLTVAVRSSATAEDLPDASFAGQQETYLNVSKNQLLERVKNCFASLFTERATFYRQEKGFDHFQVKLSVGIQKMVRSDLASSGVMFTIDPDTGLDKVIVINGVFGLGELIVQGKVIPDEFIVFKQGLEKGYKAIISKKLGKKDKKIVYAKQGIKEVDTEENEKKIFSLNEDEVLELANFGLKIEKHFKKAMDIEWAKDGVDGKIYIVQARPETVHSIKKNVIEEYVLKEKGKPILTGIAIGNKIATGKVRVIKEISKINEFQEGEILVTEMTDPDWVPIMKKAKAIITDKGGRTCFSGETKILTDKGFLTLKEVYERVKNSENLKTLSLNRNNLKLEWKEILNSFRRKSKLIEISISQSGKIQDNVLKVTPDHKFLIFNNRELISKEIDKIINDKSQVLSTVKIPPLKIFSLSQKLAYLLGIIFTDGCISLNRRHGEVSFIQKPTKEKEKLINYVRKIFKEEFNYSLYLHHKASEGGFIHGRKIKGTLAVILRCYKKEIAEKFLDFYNNLSQILLKADDKFIYSFLAGIIDGDGSYSYNSNRINIYCSDAKLFEAIIISCLRLGINFQVTKNRNIFNIQIVDHLQEIFNYTQRVKGNYERKIIGTRLLSAKQLLEDIIEKVNYKGRILSYVKFNLLIDAQKIKNYLIPMIKRSFENHQLTKIINSPLKSLRVKKIKDIGEDDVYNIEIEDNHNYLVFTSKGTPILVENCHAAIVSRELGIPCIVGTEKATQILKTGEEITVDCSQGLTGYIYEGMKDFEIIEHKIEEIPETKTKIMVNIGSPEEAWQKWYLPVKGVGLAREEFIIANEIGIHPNALIDYPNLPEEIKKKIDELTENYQDKKQFYVDKLAEGISKIAAAFYPHPVLVRFSDFKTNEYRNLIGGELYEPHEENPMLGWRGASRYYDQKFRKAFELEVLALKKARDEFGLDNIWLFVPFCRTIEEGKKVLEIIESIIGTRNGNYKVIVMCEIPSNVILADEFLEIFDGFSIGSNDLTQLVLGIDRDNALLREIGDERNEAVKKMIAEVIKKCREKNKYCGICGQAPSDFPEMVEFLVKESIESISVNPDAVIKTIFKIKKLE